MNDPLELLWPFVDAPDAAIAAHVVWGWPVGVPQKLVELGILREAEQASHVLCPECRQHFGEVLAVEGPEKSTRYVIECPEVLRAEVPPVALQQWRIDFELLAELLARSLALTGKCTELLRGRLWRLGRTEWQGKSRDVLLARGLHWNDGATVRAALVRNRKPIVFVPLGRPPDDFWRTVPPILALAHVAKLGDHAIEVEALEIAAAIQDADTRGNSVLQTSLTKEELTKMIRQEIATTAKMSLTDDIFIAAFRQHGSLRAAATFLTKETGREVSKDMVHRAVMRSGGVVAVLNSSDSNSVVRDVVSHARDKHGKPLIQSQDMKD